MSRMISSLLFLLFLIMGSQAALSPKMQQLKRVYETKMAVFATLEEKEQRLVQHIGAFVAEAEQEKVASRFAHAERVAGVYTDVQLANGNKFGVREVTKVDVEEVISGYLTSKCDLPFGIGCSDLIDPIIEFLLPDLIFLQSLNAEASSNVTSGTGALDLIIQLFTFPGSSSTLNTLLSDLLSVGIYPTTGLGYFTAHGDYTLSFQAASLDLSAQAFALLQTYTRVIEFQDANGNKIYDDGEERSTINLSNAGWTPTSYSSEDASSATVHTISSSTEDGVVTFDCQTASFPVKDSSSQILSPNATKCTITIEGFPYTSDTSQLALEVYVGLYGATFEGSADAQLTDLSLNVNAPEGLQGGQFTWVPTVDADGKSFDVTAQGSAGVSDGVVDLATSLLLKASGAADSSSRKIIFTVGGTGHTKIVWDPSVSYGDLPAESSASALVPGSLLLLLASLLAFFL